jgi:hypothetical protein
MTDAAAKEALEQTREAEKAAYNKWLIRVWKEDKKCICCDFSSIGDQFMQKIGHRQYATDFHENRGATPFDDICYLLTEKREETEATSAPSAEQQQLEAAEPVHPSQITFGETGVSHSEEVAASAPTESAQPEPAQPEAVHEKPLEREKPAVKMDPWGQSSAIGGTIAKTEAAPRKQTPNELFREMEEFFASDVRIYQSEVLSEHSGFIHALVEIFNRNVEFALGTFSARITDNKAKAWLSKIENIIHGPEMGKLSQTFPKLPVKKYIIFREARKKVNKAGLAFMDRNIEAVAEMIDYKAMKMLNTIEN